MKRIIFLILIITSAHISMAQVSNYDFLAFRLGNMFNVNPAWVTRDDGINMVLNGQSLSSSVNYADKNIMAGIYSVIGNKSGLGLKVLSSSRGAFQVFRADVSYGFHAQFSEYHSLRLGALAGINNSSLNQSRIENYTLLDHSDPTLSSSYFNTTQFIAGAGVLYSYKNLDVSASLPQIISTSQPFNSYLNTAVFYTIEANENIKVQPWISYQSIPVTKNVFGTYIKGTYKELLWLQLGYQSNKSVHSAVGVSFENIGLSYGFRSSNADFTQVGGMVHEVALSFRINKKSKKHKSSGTIDGPTTLEQIIMDLDKLLSQNVTSENRSGIRSDLDKIKQMLRNAEIDNSDPEKSKVVEQQLIMIEEKLRIIENRLSNE